MAVRSHHMIGRARCWILISKEERSPVDKIGAKPVPRLTCNHKSYPKPRASLSYINIALRHSTAYITTAKQGLFEADGPVRNERTGQHKGSTHTRAMGSHTSAIQWDESPLPRVLKIKGGKSLPVCKGAVENRSVLFGAVIRNKNSRKQHELKVHFWPRASSNSFTISQCLACSALSLGV
jgi:hypothetical protein